MIATLSSSEVQAEFDSLQARGTPFALATVVRASGLTAAKPGAKAVVDSDGEIIAGWIGGGCVRSAIRKAAKQALEKDVPQLVSVQPDEMLAEAGQTAGNVQDGIAFARNGCPSKGALDIFVEPVLPKARLLISGQSPVARALQQLAPQFGYTVEQALDDTTTPPATPPAFTVIATQGKGDLDALKAALKHPPGYLAFVGSRKKFASLAEKLRAAGHAESAIAAIRAPAGLAIDAVTPNEIALSILGEMIQHRRSGQRATRLVTETGGASA